MNEKQLLQQIAWPEEKQNMYGKLIFSFTDDLFQQQMVYIERDKDYLTVSLIAKNAFEDKPEDIQTIKFKKNNNSLELIEDKNFIALNHQDRFLSEVEKKIKLINTEGDFFPTSVIENNSQKLKP